MRTIGDFTSLRAHIRIVMPMMRTPAAVHNNACEVVATDRSRAAAISCMPAVARAARQLWCIKRQVRSQVQYLCEVNLHAQVCMPHASVGNAGL